MKPNEVDMGLNFKRKPKYGRILYVANIWLIVSDITILKGINFEGKEEDNFFSTSGLIYADWLQLYEQPRYFLSIAYQ